MRAVIDIGSNSVLLLICRRTDGRWETAEEGSWVTGLGKGRAEDGSLAAQSMALTLDALAQAAERIRAHSAEARAWATAAVRQAPNAEDFLAKVRELGIPAEILSGDDEARLGLEAVLFDPAFKRHDTLTVIDPGGRSTELATAVRQGGEWKTLHRVSVPVGALSLTEGPYSDELPGFAQHLAAVRMVDDLIGQEYIPDACGQAVTLGATGVNLVSIRERLNDWSPERIHGQELDYEEVAKSVGWLSGLTLEQRRALPGMEPGREATLHAGALVLERFLQAIHALGCAVSVRGWRHAALEDDRMFASR
jgi:exopolyphosphatase/guanosine-5'-triphosphate,3'-diphosphate pyrophosphatase